MANPVRFECEDLVPRARVAGKNGPSREQGTAAVVLLDPELTERRRRGRCRDGGQVLHTDRGAVTMQIVLVGSHEEKTEFLSSASLLSQLVGQVQEAFRVAGHRHDAGGEHVYGPITIDCRHRMVWVDGKETILTLKEYGLLTELVRHAGQTVTRDHLLDTVWGYQADVCTRTVDTHIHYLKRKMPFLEGKILCFRGVGYRLTAIDQAEPHTLRVR